ncbi:hypothetical protein LOZ12_000126 [Ophidiomyces ophidiicola]|nr:hypothetical protein LOZ38_000621 [Ophidiomyces ophidiicola]KAI2060546.1 hypothetical protein LOZ43_001684 [Ophidiomyces ophidiicola]KAI2082494.1 hypothetical protein LOZ37_000750 [Ophidiomyces ophidiicola]KAI2204662.1 hypothetical protein LOZ20_000373 [Ophidiomyces ophidiicola]KAI2237036.1 hypothetical protein LOZ12_000126 [Ophidiomyces ophidiicola]
MARHEQFFQVSSMVEMAPDKEGTFIAQSDSSDQNIHAIELGEGVSLNSNVSGKIKNPLANIPKQRLLQDVKEFANTNGLSHILPILEKGALVAKDPANWETVEGLTSDEHEAIRNEVLHKWRQPRALYLTMVLCSIGAAVQGWDQTGSNGANLSFPEAFNIVDTAGTPNAELHQWLVGLVNAGPYISSAFLGCWLSDPINRFSGRRGAIFAAAIFCVLAPIGCAVSQSWQQLLVSRLLLGLGMGIKASTVPMFCAENTPASIRGGLVMGWHLWTAFGIFLGCCANLAVKDTGSISWRLQLGSAFIPALPLLFGVFWCPESPRWYIKRGKIAKAYQSLCQLRNHEIQAARDLYYIHAHIQVEKEIIGKGSTVARFIELFTIPRVRRATLAASIVMTAQQMCGINIIAFYSSTVFAAAGASTTDALLASWGFGLVSFLFALPAVWTIDTYGRRALLLFTFPQMAWTMLAAGLAFRIPENKSSHLVVIALFIFLFAAWYAPGEGPVSYAYSAEVFPLSHREIGMAFVVSSCFFWAAALSMTFPRMLRAMTPTGAFGFYAALNVTAFVMIFLWVPETKQRTLEELDYIFAVPTKKHVYYQVFKVLPWSVRRYIFRQNTHIEPLYKLDHVTGKPDDQDRKRSRHSQILVATK